MSTKIYSASEITKKNRDQTLAYFASAQQTVSRTGGVPMKEQPRAPSAVVLLQRVEGCSDIVVSDSATPYGFNGVPGNGPGQ